MDEIINRIKNGLKAVLVCAVIPLLLSACWEDLEEISDKMAGGGEYSEAYINLKTVIQNSQTKHDGATEGTSVGNYRSGSKGTFQAEIDNASAVLNNPASTDTDYDTARLTLNTANTTFDSKLVKNRDIFIFIDRTGSISTRINNIKFAIIDIIQTTDLRNTDARYSIISYDTVIRIETSDFVNSATAQAIINSLASPEGFGDIGITESIQHATENFSWTAGSDRFAVFITDSGYLESPSFAVAQNLLISNNIISVAVIDTGQPTNTDALALFDGPPLNAYNAAPNLVSNDIINIIIPVLESNIAYW